MTDPAGEVLLEEKAPAGPWGVVAGSFPLDSAAATGSWSVAWVSGDASDEVRFTVEPFTLPRFRVEAHADRPFYRAGERPVVRGAVRYSSGGRVELLVPALAPGQTLALPVRVIPTLAGRLTAPASTLAAGGGAYEMPPVTWTIR